MTRAKERFALKFWQKASDSHEKRITNPGSHCLFQLVILLLGDHPPPLSGTCCRTGADSWQSKGCVRPGIHLTGSKDLPLGCHVVPDIIGYSLARNRNRSPWSANMDYISCKGLLSPSSAPTISLKPWSMDFGVYKISSSRSFRATQGQFR